MTVVRLPTGYWHEYASQLKGCISGANMKWWIGYPLGWERGCMTWIRLQWWGRNWIMWANGCTKQTNIWLNWKINTGQSASKDPAMLPLPASAIQHVWKKTRGSLLSWAKTIVEKRNCNCISAERDFGSFIMVAQLNSDLDENEKRERSNCSCKAGGQTCQQTPSWKAELGSTVQNQTKIASQQWFSAEMLRMKCYLVRRMIARKKLLFCFFKSNQASNHWCGEVMTNVKKKKKINKSTPTIETKCMNHPVGLELLEISTSAKPRLVASCWAC